MLFETRIKICSFFSKAVAHFFGNDVKEEKEKDKKAMEDAKDTKHKDGSKKKKKGKTKVYVSVCIWFHTIT